MVVDDSRKNNSPVGTMFQNRIKDLVSLIALIVLINKLTEVGSTSTKKALYEFLTNLTQTLNGQNSNYDMATANSAAQNKTISELKQKIFELKNENDKLRTQLSQRQAQYPPRSPRTRSYSISCDQLTPRT